MNWAETYPRLYSRAVNAIRRCIDPNHSRYEDWGARGITVYEPWIQDHTEFVRYLITLPGCFDPNLVLDRKDNDRGYEPGNLRFVSASELNLNRRPYVVTCYPEGRYENVTALPRQCYHSARRLRRRGIPVTEIAELYCVSRRTMSRIINGRE